jgi:hypothetical protein
MSKPDSSRETDSDGEITDGVEPDPDLAQK